MANMTLGNTYNFTTLAPSLLGATYNNMKVIGLLGVTEAIKHADVVTKHTAAKLAITGLPDSVYNLTFVLLENSAKESMIIAQEYIDPTSITAVSVLNATIEVFDVDTAMIDSIKLRLRELGVNNFKVTVI